VNDRDDAGAVHTVSAVRLAAMGSYSVGGRPARVEGQAIRRVALSPALAIDHDPNGTFWTEQTYVQYFCPTRLRLPLPVLLVHGGGMTGRTWETTPDGRPGWLQRFLEAGVETHVVDIVERGRAGYCALPGEEGAAQIQRSLEESWDLYRFGDRAGFAARRPYPGMRFPVHALDAFATYDVPRRPSSAPAQMEGLRRVIERIGPCIAIGHSQGGGFAFRLGTERPDLVPIVVALEPHGDFSAVRGARLDGASLLIVMGDFLDRTAVWRDLDAKTVEAVEGWRRAGGEARVERLAESGLCGHSHMMMMDAGSDEVAALVLHRIFQAHASAAGRTGRLRHTPNPIYD
jgi:pimeloyl-ACP methyl ester carboxylesterase